jgi:phage terminase large subunit
MTNEIKLPQWAECLFDEDARYIAVRGGRGSGKSRAVASALILRAASKQMRWFCGREILKAIRDSVKRLLDDEIDRQGLRHFYTSTDTEIRGNNGSLFIFGGLRGNPETIKSMEGMDGAWIEEAATVSQSSLDILIPTIRKPGSQLIFTWNPGLPTDPVDAKFCGTSAPPKTILKLVNWQDNPWFPDVLKEELEFDKRHNYGKYLHIWEGQYQQNTQARVFNNWRVEEFDTPADAVLRFGADWGFAVDPTVLVRCHIVGRTLYIDHEAYRIGCEIMDTPSLFLTVPDSERWPIVADSSRPETISHMRRNGFPKIMPAVKGPRSVEEGIEWLKSFDIVVHPRCRHTIDELTAYSYKIDPLTSQVLPVLEDKDNHVIDALRYACEGARRAQIGMAKPQMVHAVPTVSAWR